MNLDFYYNPLTLSVHVWILHRPIAKRSHWSTLVLCKDEHDGAFCSPRLVSEFVFSLCFNVVLLCIHFTEEMIPWEGPTAIGESCILY